MKITDENELAMALKGYDDIHLHIERDAGTNNSSFELWNGEKEQIGYGVLNIELDEFNDYLSQITWELLSEDSDIPIKSRTWYDSLVARTNPTIEINKGIKQ